MDTVVSAEYRNKLSAAVLQVTERCIAPEIKMKIMRVVRVGLCALMAIAVTRFCTQDSESAQAEIDRQTVNCLTSELTSEEKYRMAQLADEHNMEATRSVYDEVFSRCIVRLDQVDRQETLIRTAQQALNHDPEFQRMLRVRGLAQKHM
ncbi:hypothetical protein [Caballeronia sp. AZ7_KS35]|uniref:hypothetical protein n=1 Tax=Caballeronia sp. AZ7_KS35 TaxID=2921762 RepID=UPI0020298FD3|nr:hypothetical protein [Caballeronia sp. AZ7_KS35]